MDLILHLGAHRTGSTALVRAIEANDRLQTADGLALWPPDALRAIPAFSVLPTLGPRADKGGATAQRRIAGLRRVIGNEMAALERAGRRRLILSEENMIGLMAQNLTAGVLYPDAGVRLRAFAQALPQAPAAVGLGLRDYATFWPSAYGYTLPNRTLPRFDALAAALAAGVSAGPDPRGWPAVVDDIRTVFPGVPVLLWRQERLGAAMAVVIAALAGLPDAGGITVPAQQANRAWLAGAADLIHLIRAREPDLAGSAMIDRVATLRQVVPSERPAFAAPAAARLTATYARDLERLAATEGCRFVDV
jgi:hypothetical protein